MTTELIGTKSFLGKYGPYLLFGAGLYSLPPGRARNLYLATAALIIGGFFVMDFHEPDGENHWLNASPTVWSWLLWAGGAYTAVSLVATVVRFRRAQRTAAVWPVAAEEAPQAPVAPAPLPDTFVEDMAVPEPPFTATVTTVPKLWIPEPQRRVRRGGTTLSGIPIKDRRAVDPRNL